ncbi:YitT family protein [Oceanobacillus kapialis]|uniref:YitT family protein n=1 Tax=Oceanobacillus kapialis TaxID=481353 RepID=A0ABW5Q4H5_9BACI
MSHIFIKTIIVLTGGILQGIGMGLFLFPHFIPSGGAGGIAVLLNYWFHIHTGLALWLVNSSMLLVAVKYLGKRVAVWTVIGITMTSASIAFFEQTVIIGNRNLLVDFFCGSLLLGTGIGLLMRQSVSNGGVGVIALIVAHKRSISPGQPLFWINCSVFIFTAIVIDWKIILLALGSQWIATRIVNLICQLNFYPSYTLSWRKK